jgi:FkbM family methyltransferase
MPRHFNTARRIDFVLKAFPKLRRKIESIGFKYYQIKENWDYDINYNGERWLVQTLADQNLLKNVFDVGANHGGWAAMVLKVNPEATIHCFEVCPPTFQKLAARFSESNQKSRNIFLNPLGLSDSQSEVKINYLPDCEERSTLLEVLGPHKVEIISAKVVRGKDYCANLNIASIDCLKVDVEGAEHLVLRGFEDMLTPANVPVVQFEYG